MNEENIKEALLQGGSDEAGQLFRGYLREQIRGALWDLMQEEVKGLCGPKYAPQAAGGHRRAGSEQGVVYLGGRRRSIRRPRVRKVDESGRDHEVGLRSYGVARAHRTIEAEVADCVAQGMSMRSFERMGLEGASRGTVSRRWVSHSLKRIEQLRGRSLGEAAFFGLMLDGVYLARELTVLICIGLCCDGSKRVLDFEVGSSESYEIGRELLQRLRQRGLVFLGQPLVILDGALALEKAVMEFWPQAHIQRCLVHKERNLHAHLRRKDHGECSRLMERLRRVQGAEAGKEALAELQRFLASRNQEAFQSVQEAGERLITLHRLDAPSTLHKSLLSTNLIENLILNYRRQTNRVSRWRTDTDQAARWTAEALLWSEEGFRKITGYQDLPKLLRNLGFPPPPLPGEPAPLHPEGSDPARAVPASCHTPCAPAGSPDSARLPAPVLPQLEAGGKTGASTSQSAPPQP